MPISLDSKTTRCEITTENVREAVGAYEPPLGEIEEKLANILRELLNADRISRHDNFFKLGGDSSLFVRLLVQLREIGLNSTAREVFDAPTLATLASSLTHAVIVPPNLITENSTEIVPDMLPLISLSQAEIDKIVARVPGGVANIQDIYGLTPLQNSMLFHHFMVKDNDPYLIKNRLSFVDRTSLERYADAMQEVIKRHDILRTTFIWEGLSEPVQVVLRQVPSFFTEITLNNTGKSALEQLAQNFDLHHYRLDLTQAPLLRLLAAPESEGRWVAFQLMHHTIGDNLTLDILNAEVFAIIKGKIELLTTPTSFRQFVAQTRSGLSSAEHTRFFTELLADIDEPTLAFGLNKVGWDGDETNETTLKLSQALNDQLRIHARNLQGNLASISHLAWAQVLSKASGREAVVFGTVLHGRIQIGRENGSVMGPMFNTLPVRLDIDERNVDTALRHTHSRLSALLAHEHAPLVLAQRCSGVPTNLPMFNALLKYRRYKKTGQVVEPLSGVEFLGSVECINYPLTISLDDNYDDLCLTIQTISLMSAVRICAYMQQSLQSLLDALTYTPQKPIRALAVLPTEEHRLLLHTWNQTAVTHSPVCCLQHSFEAQVKCDGKAIAVECYGQTLSYANLNSQANQLAHYLISKGVRPDDRIALCAERSIPMIVAMLGILKSGCAYVPLDPVYPSQRLINILQDSDLIFLLADDIGRIALGQHQVPVIELENCLLTDLSIDNPNATKLGILPAHLAYVIYTSGSTGTPKGVMVEHQQAVRLFGATHDKLNFSNQDKWCLSHSISFDVSVWEIWGALCYGSQISIVPYNIILSADEFYDWICIHSITVLNQTSSVFKMLTRAKNFRSTSDRLRYIIFAGEELDPSIVREWNEKYYKSGTILVNMYGTTETTVHATFHRIKFTEKISSIGRPLEDLRVYLLDSYGDPVPLGAEGEIYIGGAGVARGYLNRPKLNADRFLIDPFSEIPAARMYRTGDGARYTSDGNLIYLGRLDHQVKIRGFRIELGEIEARLVEYSVVYEAVVQCYGNGSDARLVAYVVADADTSLVHNIRSYLLTLLPEYMVPAAYVRLSSLPLTPNGKLDRRALPAPDDKAFVRQQYETPQGEMEEKLAGIWCKLLNIQRVSRHDNFFALGGHSLMIVQLLTQLREIGLNTTAGEVFVATSLSMLASTLTHYHAVLVPPNLITEENTKITPEMLPLITLSQPEIDKIVTHVPGGVANIQDIYGLTPLQNGMLFHHLMAKDGDPYLLVSRLSFVDRTSLEIYADVLRQVVERHDILRTAIFWEGLSEPAQVVLRQVPSLLTEVKLNETKQPVLDLLIHRFDPRHYRLDLAQAPLLRLLVAQASERSWIALQLMHHIIGDHTTQEILQAEIRVLYDERKETLSTPTPFRQIVGQARLSIRSVEHTQFFTAMLADIDEPTLAFGLNDVGWDGAETNETNLKLSQTLSDQLRMHARNLQVNLASICHLAWAQVLSKASGRETVVFGTVLLGRLQLGEGSVSGIGPMINTLPLRLDIDDKSVEIVVHNTHARISALLAHEHAPLVLAQRCSGVPANLPLFNALLNHRHNRKNGIAESIPGVSFLGDEGRTNYPLIMSLNDNDDDLCLSAQVVQPMSAVRICAYVQQSLQSLVDALTYTPQKPIRALAVLPTEERRLLLHTWNQTAVTYSPVCCLQHLLEAQVECDGKAIAVECDGQTLSYAELNSQANQLAHFLISKGVKRDDRIALCAERSTTIIVAMLGILKSGCAYVPLDPLYPSQRLINILHDADPIFLLADATGCKALGRQQAQVVDLGNPLYTDLSTDNPNTTKLELSTIHLAYVIYTSGSTGTPKGVTVEHQQIVRIFGATHDKFDFNKKDNWCLSHSISFDVSVWEIWGALCYGGQISIVPHNTILSADEFYNWIYIHSVTVLNQTPSAFKMLMRADNFRSSFDGLRYIIFAGEELDPFISKEWYDKYNKNRSILVNMYGPTETTVYATFQRLENSEDFDSIGRPLPDLSAYLLDSYGELVPLGAEGEMYISGAGVARGYLNRPDLTAERFLPDPFRESPAARMYRTGDRARYTPEGNLVFLGRIDQQVKIRGFRIELGEIEARLTEHNQVHEAVVQPNGNGSDARLVAYVVADSNTFSIRNLCSYLLTLLPDYMVPAAYVCLPSLPLTPSGKLDRRALPAPDDKAFVRQHYEAPQDEMEQKLANIWCNLLNIDRISRHDNFFALGGHSLLIVRLLTQLREIGLDTTVRRVFDAPTLAALALTLIHFHALTVPCNLITADNIEITPAMLPLITLSQPEIDKIVAQVPGGVANIQDIYGLTPLQNGMLFHHLMAKEGDPYLLSNRISFINWISLERYVNALQQVVKRHDIFRTAFFWEGLGDPVQVVLRDVPSILTEITLYDTEQPAIEQLSQHFDLHRFRLDLTQAPLLRLFAAPGSEGSWVTLQLMHHTLGDHSTLERLNTEICCIMEGKIDMLTTPTPFRLFVAQVHRGVSPVEHTRFFSEMLSDFNEPTFPFGLSNVLQDRAAFIEAHLELSHTFNDQLRTLARNLQVSLATICHLAWAQVLGKASRCIAVVFGTVLLGRMQAAEGNDNIMGPMINMLPLRLDIDERSVETAVSHTHARLSALLVHEHAPLLLAQRCSAVPAGLPLFSSLLNFRHNQQVEEFSQPFPETIFIDSEERSNYPLVLSVEDNGNSLGLTAQVSSSMSAARICAYMQSSLESLSDALTHRPQQPIRALNVIPPEERTLMLHCWNQTTVTYSPVCCLHQLFEAQVECDENSIAVENGEQTLSYAELNVQANQLAHYLISKGVKPDDRIALCVERSTKMIVAMLGILKSGCAYVPLDPVYPSQRLTNILHDADPIFLLADTTGLKALGDHQVQVIEFENWSPTDLSINNPNSTNFYGIGLNPDHLAYVIYTSGSTGTPKGVMVEHQQVLRLFEATHGKFGFLKQEKWSLFHSISFDVSVWEIWGALCNGSQLSVVPYIFTRSMDEFYDWICTSGINVLTQTPSAFKMLTRAKNISSRIDQLRYVIYGGEALDPMILRNWYEKYDNGQTVLVNMYGPTEAVMIATSMICDNTLSENSFIPIGHPLSNKRIYLLDAFGEAVPIGAEGEIYIGGAGLARGYLNRPDLTAERFPPDPFSETPAARMYRTGDRARFLPDGNLVFLGRMDQQVKIRGFRIEVGEIEARLVEYPQAHEAVIQCYGNGSDARLVAYVVVDTNTSLIENLRNYLLTVLPDYMVPAAYVCLASLPLTPNGKLDRRALPAPDDKAFVRQQYEAPQGETEQILANIWSELLSIDLISRYDNFFELGGHSLLLMHFVNKANLYHMHIDARGAFSFPILKNLAHQITSGSTRFHCDFAIPARQHGNETALFLLPDGMGNISYAFELIRDIDKNIPVYVLPWPSPENKQPSSIEEMANALIPLIKNVRINGPCAIAGYSSGGILAFEITKQLVSSGYPVSYLGFIDTYAPSPNIISETEMFLTSIRRGVPVFKKFDDSMWWDRVSKLTVEEVINEIHNTDLDLNNTDIEWEALLSKQRRNYQEICTASIIDSLAIKIHLFKAIDFENQLDTSEECSSNTYKKWFNYSKLGWETYSHSIGFNIILVDGNHFTMITDPKNRSLLGEKLSKSLQSKIT